MTAFWRVVSPRLLCWREIDGQWLLHDAGSARLHVLDDLTAAVLSALEGGSGSAHEIAQRLSAESGRAIDGAMVADVMRNLRSVDLVEPALP